METVHDTTGQSAVILAKSVSYKVDFTGMGSAELQVRSDGDDWAQADAPVTGSMSAAAVASRGSDAEAAQWRWNVTVTSGNITTHLVPRELAEL